LSLRNYELIGGTKLYSNKQYFRLFGEKEFDVYEREQIDTIKDEIEMESESYILNVNETEFINYIANKYVLKEPQFDFDNIFVSTYQKEIEGKYWPRGYNVYGDKFYSVDVIVYHIPFNGMSKLLKYIPNPRMLWTEKVYIEEQCLCYEIISFEKDASKVKREFKSFINNLNQQLNNLTGNVRQYNNKLYNFVKSTLQSKKQKILVKNNMLATLGAPIKKVDNISKTFSVPISKSKKELVLKPSVTEKGFTPEPTLDPDIYEDILAIIYDVGKQFERLPSTYYRKDEEHLRDHFLLFLQPRYEWSATGETFNKSGKTDILIRYNNSNIFIAECKFWKGSKNYLATITQLLGYLTWRDSKAAVIIFVRNKDFSAVLKSVEETTDQHPNYLGFVNKQNDSWFNYRFHINGDKNREVKVAVLLFHIPSI
jgi:hypothetical protein